MQPKPAGDRPLHLVVVFANGVGVDYRDVARIEVADGDLILTSTRGQVISFSAGDWYGYGPVDLDGDAFTLTRLADEAAAL